MEYNVKLLKEDPYKLCQHLFPAIYQNKRFLQRDLDSLVESHLSLNKAIEGNYYYDGDEELDDILPLFLTKSEDWHYEQEWRVIYTKKQMYDINEEELYAGNLKFPCISGVYLGYRIHPEKRDNILEICKRIGEDKRKIPVYIEKLDEKSYDIMFEKL